MDTAVDVVAGDRVIEGLDADMRALAARVETLESQCAEQAVDDKLSIVCFSGEWDRLFATLTMAAGALAMGMEVHLFFTFWAMSALRFAGRTDNRDRSFLQTMFGWLLPCGPRRAPLSKFNYGGLGKFLMRKVMRDNGVDDVDRLFDDVKELGAHFHLCDTTTQLFGLRCSDLNVGDEADQCGVTTFLALALKSKIVLFV